MSVLTPEGDIARRNSIAAMMAQKKTSFGRVPRKGDRSIDSKFLQGLHAGLTSLQSGVAASGGFHSVATGVLTSELKPTYRTSNTPETATCELFALDTVDGDQNISEKEIIITNRTSGYWYNSTVVHIYSATNEPTWYILHPSGTEVVGKTDSELSAGSTANLSIYGYDNSIPDWVDTGVKVTVRDIFQWTVPANKFVIARHFNHVIVHGAEGDSFWVPIAAEC